MATLNPKIYTKTEWSARPVIAQDLEYGPVTPVYIVVHYSSQNQLTSSTDGAEMRRIQYMHQLDTNGVGGDIGYNFGIGRYGSIMEGRSLYYVGAHCIPTNRNSIGVCVFTGDEGPTSDQYDSLISLLGYLCLKYSIQPNNIKGHKDFSSTLCPGTHLYNNLSSIRSQVTSLITPSTPSKVNVTYQVYVDGRWLPNVTNLADYAGIYGRPVQAIYANTDIGQIKYRVHTTNGTWLPWVIQRQDYAGIFGKNIDGLQMVMNNDTSKSVNYRVYVNGRWLPWVSDLSDYAGIYGQNIEGVQVNVVNK